MDFTSIMGNPYLITAYIISIIGYGLFAIASGLKKKKHLLICQSTANALCAVAEGMTGLWSGLVQDAVNFIRNLFVLKKWMNTALAIIFIVLGTGIGIFVFIYDFEHAKWWGLLPVVATLEYSIVILIPRVRIEIVKIAIMVSSSCWTVYGYGMNFIPTMAFNLLSFILATISLITIIVKRKHKEVNVDNMDRNELQETLKTTEM